MGTFQDIISQPIVGNIGWMLIHFIWQGAAAMLALAVTLRIMRKCSANARYLTACSFLLLIVIMPVGTFVMISGSPQNASDQNADLAAIAPPLDAISGEGVAEIVQADDQIGAALMGMEISPTGSMLAVEISKIDKIISDIESLLPYMVVGWWVGVLALSLWHLGGYAQLCRLRWRTVKPVDSKLISKMQNIAAALSVSKPVKLLESAIVQVPVVLGHFKPVILLPASMVSGLNITQIESILAHELAHVRRHDYLVNIFQTAIEILGFYHPAVWWMSHKIRAERENCCDDLAVGVTGDKIRYAKALTSLAELRQAQYACAIAASGGNLFNRISRLMHNDSPRKSRPGWIPSLLAVIAAIAVMQSATVLAKPKADVVMPPQAEEQQQIKKPVDELVIEMHKLVEDFFKNNYRDITARKTISWGQPKVDANGNKSIRYRYEATIWDKDKIINDQLFVFDKNNKYISADNYSTAAEDELAAKALDPQTIEMRRLVGKFFNNNYRDITARKTLLWGEPVIDAKGNKSIRYRYEATIRGRDKIINDQIFVFDKNNKYVSAEKYASVEDKAEATEKFYAYKLDKKVSEFSEEEDFSTPQSAYAAVNRVMCIGDNKDWQRVSAKKLFDVLARIKELPKNYEKSKFYQNAHIKEVLVCGKHAIVYAELAPGAESNDSYPTFDARHVVYEDGKWLNQGQDVFSNMSRARAKFFRRFNVTSDPENIEYSMGYKPIEAEAKKPDDDQAAPPANIKVLDLEMLPVGRGNNTLIATVENLTDSEQVFGIHIYTRGGGRGWGRNQFATLKPMETRAIKFAYKLYAPIMDEAFIRVKYYNPESEEKCDYENFYKKLEFQVSSLPVRGKGQIVEADTDTQAEILKQFQAAQRFIKDKKFEQVWNMFTEDYHASGCASGFERFKQAMQEVGTTVSGCIWDERKFIKLQPDYMFYDLETDTIVMQAKYKKEHWKIFFSNSAGVWNINDVHANVMGKHLVSKFEQYVENFFRYNYTELKDRKTLHLRVIDVISEEGYATVDYKFEVTVNGEPIVIDHRFIFNDNGWVVGGNTISVHKIGSQLWAQQYAQDYILSFIYEGELSDWSSVVRQSNDRYRISCKEYASNKDYVEYSVVLNIVGGGLSAKISNYRSDGTLVESSTRYLVGYRVAQYPDNGDLSTPEDAYATFIRAYVAGGPNYVNRFCVKKTTAWNANELLPRERDVSKWKDDFGEIYIDYVEVEGTRATVHVSLPKKYRDRSNELVQGIHQLVLVNGKWLVDGHKATFNDKVHSILE